MPNVWKINSSNFRIFKNKYNIKKEEKRGWATFGHPKNDWEFAILPSQSFERYIYGTM